MILRAEGRPLRDRYGDTVAHQACLWPTPVQLCLPEQLMLPESPSEPLRPQPYVPAGVDPVEPPDAHAALECVARILRTTSAVLRVPEPRVRWYRALPVQGGAESYEWMRGFHWPGQSDIWINVVYATPEELARTVAHEVIHYWQDRSRWRCLDDLEHREREGEAERRAQTIVPTGTIRMPRGKKRDAWFEPARRIFGHPTVGE